ncbi:filamin-A-like [Bradysia coprophila]|uniref:filamin-A-like n=1 Tax=Bradysia coprophila TaxID=38358 RepID=UPI00187DC225|nr:filamin-A-like [Bradysia coprophila]
MADIAKAIQCQGTNLNNGFAEGPNKFVILTTPKHDVKKLQIGFEGPSQPETKLVTKANKNVDVTFTTPVGGNYKIHVMYDEHYVSGSPYNCKLVGDVKPSVDKIKVSGAVKEAKKDEENVILIDGKDVGISAFTAKMEGPSKADLAFNDNDDGTVSATFKPTEPGTYKLILKFTHFNLPGSPFSITVA